MNLFSFALAVQAAKSTKTDIHIRMLQQEP